MDSNNESWRVLGLSVVDCGLCKLMETWRLSSSSALIILSSLFVGVAGMSLILNWLSPGGAAWAHYHTHGRFKRRSMAPEPVPGPSGWPIIGSLTLMGSAAHKNLARVAESYGARRLMALSLGFTRLMISSEPEVAREILNSSAFADRPVKESAYGLMFHRAIGFAPYSDYWRHLRRIAATHLFAPKRIAAAENTRQIIADSMVDDIRNTMCATGSVKVREIFRRASLNNTLGSVFGRRYDFGAGAAMKDTEARDVALMVEEGYDLLGKFNWADHLPLPGFFDLQGIRRRCAKLVPIVNDFVQKVIDQHRAVPKNSDSTDCDFVDVLLGLEGDQKLGDQDMVAVLWEMIFRGTDTVAILMEWTLARMVLHLDIQEKLHEELNRVVGRGRRVRDSDIQKLHYLQAVVKEVLRMHPPGPLLSWARLAIHDVDVAGHFVPAGTTAMVNMWDITHNKEIWSDPYAFNPDRFLPDQGGEEINIMGCDLRLAPFGSGRRVCPGKALGLATVHLWLARMLHHFQWLPCPHHPVDLSEVLRLSCEMQLPLCVRAINRKNIDVGFQ